MIMMCFLVVVCLLLCPVDVCWSCCSATLLSHPLFIGEPSFVDPPLHCFLIILANALSCFPSFPNSLDKVTSVYIHMSPPITLYVVRWLYPDPNYTRFSALKDMPVLPTSSSLTYAIALYLTWQVAYYVFVVVRQKEKIKAGKRVTSYTWLLNDPKAGVISKVAHTFGEKYSIITFMGMQLIYTVRIPLGSLAMLTYVDLSLHFLYLFFLTLTLSHLFSLLIHFPSANVYYCSSNPPFSYFVASLSLLPYTVPFNTNHFFILQFNATPIVRDMSVCAAVVQVLPTEHCVSCRSVLGQCLEWSELLHGSVQQTV